MKNGNLLERIVVDPSVQHGKPCLKGTRIPVYVLLESLSLGMTVEEIKEEYPPVKDKDVQAALLFAALLAKEEEIPLAATT